MENKRSFIDELNNVSRPREEIKNSEALRKARQDYDQIKKKLLNLAKKGGYSVQGTSKVVSYMHEPAHPFNFYRQDGGVEIKKTFWGMKSSLSKSIGCFPQDEVAWNDYITELRNLCSKDKISIRPVLYDEIFSKIISCFPTTIYNPKPGQLSGAELRIEYVVRF